MNAQTQNAVSYSVMREVIQLSQLRRVLARRDMVSPEMGFCRSERVMMAVMSLISGMCPELK